MKKIWKGVSTVLTWSIVVIAVAMMVFTIISVNTVNRNDRSMFGYRAYVVLSDSMSATDFSSGDLVVVKEVDDPSTLQPGDIISFRSTNPDTYGETFTHKIRRLTVDETGEPGFITYGTTTGTDDVGVVTYSFVQGKYQFAIPKLGSFFVFLKSPVGYVVCILIPFLLLIGYQALNCVRLFRCYREEQMAEIQAEKDAAEAERKKAEEMMEELRAMQAQMTASAPSQPDIEAMMAELAALRAQVAANEQANAAAAGKTDGEPADAVGTEV